MSDEPSIPATEIMPVPIDQIKVDGKNPNQMSKEKYEALKRGIKKYGVLLPVVVNRDYVIADGEHRWRAAKELGMTTIPVTVVNLKEVDRHILRQVLNKLRGEHDADLDAEEYRIIFSENGQDDFRDLLALSEKEYEGIVSLIRDDPAQPEPPAADPRTITTSIVLGQVFQLGDHRLMCGDSTNDVARLTLFGREKIDLLLTDPPYGIDIVKKNQVGIGAPAFGQVGRSGFVPPRTYRPVIGDDKPFAPGPFLDLARVTILFGANIYARDLPESAHWIVWDKKAGVGADKNSFGDVELAWTNIDRKSSVIYRHLWSGLLREGARDEELNERVHPTQKPVGLFKEIIKDYTQEREVVADLFLGSGTTLIACERTNRRCFGMEIDPVYCQIIINRWETLTGKKATLIEATS